MKKFLVERNLPGAGNLSPAELAAISAAYRNTFTQTGGIYQWVETYVTADKLYCLHIAESEEAVWKYAGVFHLPVNSVQEIILSIGPHSNFKP